MLKKSGSSIFKTNLFILSCITISLHAKEKIWQQIQEQCRNAVIQIISADIEFDWRQPFKTPEQRISCGTGFIIDTEGRIVTNAHVVEKSAGLFIQMLALGKRPVRVKIIGLCPDLDLALLQIEKKDLDLIKNSLGKIPYLELGDSDSVRQTDEVLVLGYPLGLEWLTSQSGVVSGITPWGIQTDAGTNPGNSGGPYINSEGKVIGVHSQGISSKEANNIGYAIPINILHSIIGNLNGLQYASYLGVVYTRVTDDTTGYLGNPEPGGCYIVEVTPDSAAANAGLQSGDMIYEIDGHSVDTYGDIFTSSNYDKIAINGYVIKLPQNSVINLVYYRNGEKKQTTIKLEKKQTGLRKKYPLYEQIDYEVFGGMVIMELSENHIQLFAEKAPALKLYTTPQGQSKSALIVSHIFPNSQAAEIRSVGFGYTITELNGVPVSTLEEWRNALKIGLQTNMFVLKVADQVRLTSTRIPYVMSFEVAVRETITLSKQYAYPLSDTVTTCAKELGLL